MSDTCVAQWLEQSTGNRKTWARILAQSKASFFHRKIFKLFKYIFIIELFYFVSITIKKVHLNTFKYKYNMVLLRGVDPCRYLRLGKLQ